MSRTSLVLCVLCVLVLSLLAFGPTGAQAETGAKWLILNSKGELKEGSTLHSSIGLEKDSSVLILHTEILKVKVLFLCTEIKLIEAKLLTEGSIGKEAGVVKGSKVLFSGCTTDLNGVAAPECTPKDATDGEGKIVSKSGHALIIEGAPSEDLLRVIPDEGETYATIELPAACPIGTKVPVIGNLLLKDGEGFALTHLVKHLLESAPPTELFTISKTAEHAATILGSAWASLTGEHAGLKWSGDRGVRVEEEKAPKWLFLNLIGQLKEGGSLHPSVGLESDSSILVLHSEILKNKVLFLCIGINLIEAKLLAGGSIGKEAGVVKGSKVLFSSCTTELNEKAAPGCTPIDSTDGEGKIVGKSFHASLVPVTGEEDLLQVIPDEGETYATIELPAACPIGTKVPVIGKLFLKDGENLALTHLAKHLIEPGPGTELWVVSKTTEHIATLLGSTWAKLTGEHEGLKWSGDPAAKKEEEKEEEKKEETPNWLILNSKGELKKGINLQASVGLEKDSSSFVLHSEILKVKALFLCTELKAVNARLLAGGNIGEKAGTIKNSKVLFSGCTTDLNGVAAPECTPKDATDGEGFIVTKSLHASLVLGTGGEDLLQVLPDEGEIFVTMELPAACPIGTKVPVIGKLLFKDCENLALTHLAKHLIEPGPGTELWVVSKTTEHIATLLGSAWAKLTGEHEGLKWSGDPA